MYKNQKRNVKSRMFFGISLKYVFSDNNFRETKLFDTPTWAPS